MREWSSFGDVFGPIHGPQEPNSEARSLLTLSCELVLGISTHISGAPGMGIQHPQWFSAGFIDETPPCWDPAHLSTDPKGSPPSRLPGQHQPRGEQSLETQRTHRNLTSWNGSGVQEQKTRSHSIQITDGSILRGQWPSSVSKMTHHHSPSLSGTFHAKTRQVPGKPQRVGHSNQESYSDSCRHSESCPFTL